MTQREKYEQKAEAIMMPILEANGFTLVDCEYVKEVSDYYLRFYIDREGGINVDDCETVSRAYSAIVDVDDFISEAYILEVSSPGLGRAIKKDKDFQRNLEKEVEIRLFKAVDGERELVGVLKAWDKDSITVDEAGKELILERKNLSKISEYVDWNAVSKADFDEE